MSVLAVCPSRNRPQRAKETLASFLATRADPASRIVFVVDRDDETLAEYPQDYIHTVEPGGGMGAAIAAAVADKKLLGDATVVGMVGDDNRWRTNGWDRVFLDWLVAHPGVAYGDDLLQHERLPTSWWVSRPLVDAFGLAGAGLRHFYMDNFWKSLASGAGVLRYFPEVVIEHLHPDAGKAPMDGIYQRAIDSHAAADRERFERWGREQRDADIERVREILATAKPPARWRILADWHHGALYESLAMLFVDRFGADLYRPVGQDWFTAGYWGFNNRAIGMEWWDFIGASPEDRNLGDHFERPNPQYPRRPYQLVTLAQARAQRWDFVVGSLSQHQAGFARLAKDLGARFVHQVGNAQHPIDWGLEPLVLASAKIPLPGKGVIYHQEFSLDRFGYSKPATTSVVMNASLRFSWTECYKIWKGAREIMPNLEWVDHGTTLGTFVDQDAVAAEMRRASWAWHDKPISDGYGHVIHNWAAMGRPLIGHASHYAGALAEPFWRHGETAFDLDSISLSDLLKILGENDADRLGEMSQRLAETFRSVVDFDADARAVEDLLTS